MNNEKTKAQLKRETKVLDNQTIMNIMTKQVEVNEANNGQEFYRHAYDKALHIRVALEQAGYHIVWSGAKIRT